MYSVTSMQKLVQNIRWLRILRHANASTCGGCGHFNMWILHPAEQMPCRCKAHLVPPVGGIGGEQGLEASCEAEAGGTAALGITLCSRNMPLVLFLGPTKLLQLHLSRHAMQLRHVPCGSHCKADSALCASVQQGDSRCARGISRFQIIYLFRVMLANYAILVAKLRR